MEVRSRLDASADSMTESGQAPSARRPFLGRRDSSRPEYPWMPPGLQGPRGSKALVSRSWLQRSTKQPPRVSTRRTRRRGQPRSARGWAAESKRDRASRGLIDAWGVPESERDPAARSTQGRDRGLWAWQSRAGSVAGISGLRPPLGEAARSANRFQPTARPRRSVDHGWSNLPAAQPRRDSRQQLCSP